MNSHKSVQDVEVLKNVTVKTVTFINIFIILSRLVEWLDIHVSVWQNNQHKFGSKKAHLSHLISGCLSKWKSLCILLMCSEGC